MYFDFEHVKYYTTFTHPYIWYSAFAQLYDFFVAWKLDRIIVQPDPASFGVLWASSKVHGQIKMPVMQVWCYFIASACLQRME